jgi:hypothetical protein
VVPCMPPEAGKIQEKGRKPSCSGIPYRVLYFEGRGRYFGGGGHLGNPWRTPDDKAMEPSLLLLLLLPVTPSSSCSCDQVRCSSRCSPYYKSSSMVASSFRCSSSSCSGDQVPHSSRCSPYSPRSGDMVDCSSRCSPYSSRSDDKVEVRS